MRSRLAHVGTVTCCHLNCGHVLSRGPSWGQASSRMRETGKPGSSEATWAVPGGRRKPAHRPLLWVLEVPAPLICGWGHKAAQGMCPDVGCWPPAVTAGSAPGPGVQKRPTGGCRKQARNFHCLRLPGTLVAAQGLSSSQQTVSPSSSVEAPPPGPPGELCWDRVSTEVAEMR